MSLEQSQVVDYLVTTKDSNVVELLVFDPYDWSNFDVHLAMLIKKLDLYLTFIESGEVLTCGHALPAEPRYVFSVRYVHPVPRRAGVALAELTSCLSESGITLDFRSATPD